MTFENGILDQSNFQAARHIGDEISPEIVILHDTASRLTKGAAANYLRSNNRKVSVHFVVERDGSYVQQVPVNRRANHAGKSHWHGRDGCNGFSIGIEIVNPGRMAWADDERAVAWFGKKFSAQDYELVQMETPQHGHGVWMGYTEAQITTVIELLDHLFANVPSLKDITTHWYVSPGRKTDTNPLFPLEQVRARVLGRDDPQDEEAMGLSLAAPIAEMVITHTPGDVLNMRRWPSFNPNVIARIPDGAVLPLLRGGKFNQREWLCVQYGGQEGWIVASYADPYIERQEFHGDP